MIGGERFLAEIKVTANLQHPHILPLHDSGEADGFLFYVMPYVEGESLRERLMREKQLPVSDAVRIATEVAAALDYAHRHGVIHRDIKPENILLHDGQALVADFGIALAVSSAGGTRLTETGLSLGTPHYMSPEQAMGEREITAKSDVYALGATLYEMLVGEPPFTGPTAQAIVAKVVTEEPRPIIPQRHTVPAEVEAAVLTALEKLPADRFATASQFAEALTIPAAPRVPRPARAGRPRWLTPRESTLLLLTVVGVATGAWGLLRERPTSHSTVSFAVTLPRGVQLAGWRTGPGLALSPDGNRLAFVGFDGQQNRLYLRTMGGLEARPLSGTEGASGPFFSPDGQWVGFFTGTAVKRVPVAGGSPTSMIDGFAGPDQGRGASWVGGVAVLSGVGTPLERASVSGGPLKAVTTLDTAAGEISHRFPNVLPTGETVLFTILSIRPGTTNSNIAAARLKTGKAKELVPDAALARYAEPGYLIYARPDGALFGAPFDAKRLEVSGPSVQVLDSVAINAGNGAVNFTLSSNGSLAYIRGSLAQQLAVVDRAGGTRALSAERRFYTQVRVSPDGRRIAAVIEKAGYDDLWIYDSEQGTLSRLTSEFSPRNPAWSPDARWLAYGLYLFGPGRSSGATYGLYMAAADGSGPPQSLLTNPPGEVVAIPAWTSDGRALVYQRPDSARGSDLWLLPLTGERVPRPLVTTPFDERQPAVSPDDRWLAYTSNESGQDEIYVRPLSGGSRWQVSSGGGSEARWPRGGHELFYRNGNRITAAAVSPGSVFAVTARTVVFQGDFQDYDVYPDGRRLLVIKPLDEPLQLIVVVNWLEDVRRKLKAAK